MKGKLGWQAVFLIRLHCPGSRHQHKPCPRTLTKRTSHSRVSQLQPRNTMLQLRSLLRRSLRAAPRAETPS